MKNELEILKLADDYKLVEYKKAKAYLIVNRKMEDYQCMFGFVEFPNDIDQAKGLFDLLEEEAKKRGFNAIVGPINYSTWMSYRFAISNFEFKLFPDCDNPEYYPKMIEELGYKELNTYRSALIDINNPLFLMGEDIYKEKLSEGFIFKRYENEETYKVAREIYDISINAFEGANLYSHIPYEAFEEIYLTWTRGLSSGLFIAYYKDEPVGYVFGYEDPVNKLFISKTSAVKKECQKNKLYIALLFLGNQYVLDKGYESMLYHFQCEQNNTFKRFEKHIEAKEKRYAVYIKELNNEGM